MKEILFYVKIWEIINEGENMNLIRGWGFISSLTLYALIFFFFPIIFGNTPVNLFDLGSRDGISNLFINLISYGIIVIIIAFIPSLFIVNKKNWLRVNLIGTVVAIILFLIISTLYLAIFWR
ncbi:hypothetical protein V7150_20570 [Neobacillus drentensis]|uniref:hypothetical protein n=1 Tax=Neobacillus drentensis TaxID=220684 RepID=UPI002FFED8FF